MSWERQKYMPPHVTANSFFTLTIPAVVWPQIIGVTTTLLHYIEYPIPMQASNWIPASMCCHLLHYRLDWEGYMYIYIFKWLPSKEPSGISFSSGRIRKTHVSCPRRRTQRQKESHQHGQPSRGVVWHPWSSWVDVGTHRSRQGHGSLEVGKRVT